MFKPVRLNPVGRLRIGVLFAILLWAGLIVPPGWTQEKPKDDFSRWESAIAAFEKQDLQKPPPKQAILFVGSSSIRLWDLAKSFPELDVINRGFGGSHIADSAHFADRLILKHQPRLVVVYAGDNDLAAGKTPEQLLADYQSLVSAIHKALPKTPIAFIAIKPSLDRWHLYDQQCKTNALIVGFCKKDERLFFIDIVKPMLGKDGKPRPELFVADGLHLSPRGYELWAKIVKPYLK